MARKVYDKKLFEKWVKPDSSSPSGLVWIKPRFFNGTPNYDRIGTPAGHVVNNHGVPSYWNIRLEGKDYLVHRIICVLNNDKITESDVVDHVNRNGLDNSVSNLRIVSAAVNRKNANKRVNNKSGVTGVSLHSNNGVPSGYIACIGRRGYQICKYFSFKKYGNTAFTEAVNCRNIMKLSDSEYTELHGE